MVDDVARAGARALAGRRAGMRALEVGARSAASLDAPFRVSRNAGSLRFVVGAGVRGVVRTCSPRHARLLLEPGLPVLLRRRFRMADPIRGDAGIAARDALLAIRRRAGG